MRTGSQVYWREFSLGGRGDHGFSNGFRVQGDVLGRLLVALMRKPE